MLVSWPFSPSLLPSLPPPSLPLLLPLGACTWLLLRSPFPSEVALSDLPSWPSVIPLGSPAPRNHPKAGNRFGTSSPAPSFSSGETGGSELLELPTGRPHFHLRSRKGAARRLPLPAWKSGGRAAWAGRAQRNTVSAPGCGSVLSWLHSYLFVCLCVCEFCGREAGSE